MVSFENRHKLQEKNSHPKKEKSLSSTVTPPITELYPS